MLFLNLDTAISLAANFASETDLHPFLDTVSIAYAGIFSPGIKQYDNNRFAHYFRLHDQAATGFAEKTCFRYTNIPIPATHQIVGIGKLQATVVFGEGHRMRSGGRKFTDDVVIICSITIFARSRAVETLALFNPVESTK